MIEPEEIKQMILASLPDAQVDVTDTTGTRDHFYIEVRSKEFTGKSLIEQHQRVFSVLSKEMDNRIHAVQLKTKAV